MDGIGPSPCASEVKWTRPCRLRRRHSAAALSIRPVVSLRSSSAQRKAMLAGVVPCAAGAASCRSATRWPRRSASRWCSLPGFSEGFSEAAPPELPRGAPACRGRFAGRDQPDAPLPSLLFRLCSLCLGVHRLRLGELDLPLHGDLFALVELHLDRIDRAQHAVTDRRAVVGCVDGRLADRAIVREGDRQLRGARLVAFELTLLEGVGAVRSVQAGALQLVLGVVLVELLCLLAVRLHLLELTFVLILLGHLLVGQGELLFQTLVLGFYLGLLGSTPTGQKERRCHHEDHFVHGRGCYSDRLVGIHPSDLLAGRASDFPPPCQRSVMR